MGTPLFQQTSLRDNGLLQNYEKLSGKNLRFALRARSQNYSGIFSRQARLGMEVFEKDMGLEPGSMPIIIVAKLKTSLRPIPKVREKGDPIAYIEISPLPPINVLQNLLGVMGVAKYYDINPLSKFIHGEGLE